MTSVIIIDDLTIEASGNAWRAYANGITGFGFNPMLAIVDYDIQAQQEIIEDSESVVSTAKGAKQQSTENYYTLKNHRELMTSGEHCHV